MSNPMKAYQRVRITTATPAELIVLLFDGLVRFIGTAADAMEEGRFADAGRSFERAVEIVGHLRESLDEGVSPALVASLDKTYALWAHCLVKAQLERDPAQARDIGAQALELAEAWRTVVSQGRAESSGVAR